MNLTKVTEKAEILAPAGSVEQLTAAVNNGCDSVYLGLDCFNARMKAPNFTRDNVAQYIDYCHLFGVKVYVAINTSLKNSEFDDAVDTLNFVYRNNADGVILTDVALIRLASQLPKPFEVVASTQLNVHDSFGAKFLQSCGATTVVCARESSLGEIRDVASTGVKVECFIHGATCVCQSGQCLFSSMVGGNSGNRGLCAQPCRKLYSVDCGASFSYLLSARDLCGLNNAKQLVESGATVFKIEGRNRRAEYAGITSRVYKKLLENGFAVSQDDKTQLLEMYNRASSPLNYLKRDNSDIIYNQSQNHIGVVVGKVSKDGFVSNCYINKGDGLKIFDGEREVCGAVATCDGVGFVKAEFAADVRDGMTVRRTTSVALCNDVLSMKRLLPVSLKFIAQVGSHVKITATCQGVTVEYSSDFVAQQAEKIATTKPEIAQQLQKTGDSCYTITDIAMEIGHIFLAKSQINGMRRQILQLLTDEIVRRYNADLGDRNTNSIAICSESSSLKSITELYQKHGDSVVAVICRSVAELRQAKGKSDCLIYKPEFVNETTLKEAHDYNAFVDLPAFSDNAYLYDILSEVQVGIVCHNVGQVQLARALNLRYVAGSGLNIYNDYMANEFDDAETFVYSLELTLGEIAQFNRQDGLVFVDGKLMLMKVVHCPYKLAYNCSCGSCQADKMLTYTDELGNKFTYVRRKDSRCTFELVNGNKLSVVSKLRGSGRYLIDYDAKVLDHYVNLNRGEIDNYVETQPYTKGRLYSKVK